MPSLAANAASKIADAAGGKARLQVIVLLAGVLGLSTADMGAMSAVSRPLKQAFSIGNTEFGLLLAVVSFAGAIGTLPMGGLVDRHSRKLILRWSIAAWIVAMVLSGFATSYLFMMGARLLLGVVTSAAWPSVASMSGDFFPASERARNYGMILAGELVGAGAGFFISGEISSLLGWRWSFWAMAVLSSGLLAAVWLFLPGPARGAQSWLRQGETDPAAAKRPHPDDGQGGGQGGSNIARDIARKKRIAPREALVLRQDPTRRSWLWAIRYCLRIPTYRVIVVASALAYYFFSGARAFAMIYFTRHYDISRAALSALVMVLGLGALAGVVFGGWLSEWFMRRGRLTVRIVLPAVGLLASTPFLAFGIWTHSAWWGLASMTVGAAFLSAAMPPIDAARLDIVHPRLWGRAEAGRMLLRSTFEGTAPLVFGALSGWLGGGERGLEWTFLLTVTPMIVACGLVIPARRSYPQDVATAAASVDSVSRAGKAGKG